MSQPIFPRPKPGPGTPKYEIERLEKALHETQEALTKFHTDLWDLYYSRDGFDSMSGEEIRASLLRQARTDRESLSPLVKRAEQAEATLAQRDQQIETLKRGAQATIDSLSADVSRRFEIEATLRADLIQVEATHEALRQLVKQQVENMRAVIRVCRGRQAEPGDERIADNLVVYADLLDEAIQAPAPASQEQP